MIANSNRNVLRPNVLGITNKTFKRRNIAQIPNTFDVFPGWNELDRVESTYLGGINFTHKWGIKIKMRCMA